MSVTRPDAPAQVLAPFDDGERAAVALERLVEGAELLPHDAAIAQRPRGVRVVRPQHAFADVQGAGIIP
eukprot:CAMPEP_0198604654 /NCGR_PEP_ID=MMETSP1462-20131121/153480_1 /TAXON_ID=1333877 /ORGANISM="Brandtodinium nutriculum, Strain RCC3387" /LENGTH=68 /DNA_ID=CAMNT_0044336441 /DNA_START=30 /DNA_END=234 /DNA_ORIENTATION=-